MTTQVKIIKKRDDPNGVARVSVGGKPNVGVYCVYRGTAQQAITCLRTALAVLEHMRAEPAVSPDDGKEFA